MKDPFSLISNTLSDLFSGHPYLFTFTMLSLWLFLWLYKTARTLETTKKTELVVRYDKTLEAYGAIEQGIALHLRRSLTAETEVKLFESIGKASPYLSHKIREQLVTCMDTPDEVVWRTCLASVRKEVRVFVEKNEGSLPYVSTGDSVNRVHFEFLEVMSFVRPNFTAFIIYFVFVGIATWLVFLYLPFAWTEKVSFSISLFCGVFVFMGILMLLAAMIDKKKLTMDIWLLFGSVILGCLTALFIGNLYLKMIPLVIMVGLVWFFAKRIFR